MRQDRWRPKATPGNIAGAGADFLFLQRDGSSMRLLYLLSTARIFGGSGCHHRTRGRANGLASDFCCDATSMSLRLLRSNLLIPDPERFDLRLGLERLRMRKLRQP